LNPGVFRGFLGKWQPPYAFLARSGKAFTPGWGGASNFCAPPGATICVPATIAGLAPNSNDPANLSNAGGSITGYARPSVAGGCPAIPDKQTLSKRDNPSCFVNPGAPAGRSPFRFLHTPRGGVGASARCELGVAA